MPVLQPPKAAPPVDGLSDRVFLQTADFGPPPPPKDQAYYFRSLQRALPKNYVDGLTVAGGVENLYAVAAVTARVSLAMSRWNAATLVGYAQLGRRATGWVYFWRQSSTAGAVTVKHGTIVGTNDRRLFFTKTDVVFGPTDLGPFAVEVEATLPGFEYNIDGEHLTALNETIPGEITSIYTLLEEPDFGDPSIQVRNVAPFEGGVDAQLEQLAEDRGVSPKHADETEDAFRLRIKTGINGVTPASITRVGLALFRRWSPTFQFAIIDAWNPTYQTGYDGPIPGVPDFPATLFVYDDPRPPGPYNRWLSQEGANGGEFIAIMSYLPCLTDSTFWLDDPADAPGKYLTPGTDGGARAASFLDLPDVLPGGLLQSCLNGRDAAADGVYASVNKMLNDLRAGGVSYYQILLGQP